LPILDPSSSFCFRHAIHNKKVQDDADLVSELTSSCDSFESAVGINHSLRDLYILLAQNRISPRRAAILAYISNLLLRTLPAIEHELNPSGEYPTEIIIDVPRPNRQPTEPESQPS
jgi:hypothetical protein